MTLHVSAMQGMDLALWVFFGWLFYFLPFAIAVLRRNGRESLVLLVNAALGWTVAGWFFAMKLALHDDTRPSRGRQGTPVHARRQRRRSLYSTSNLSTFSS